MTAIIKREAAAYFKTPLGFVFLGIFCGFSGLFLWMNCLSLGAASMSGVFVLMFFVIMIIIPLLTMRTFADERAHKADRLIMTSPVSSAGIAVGKFLAAFFVFFAASLILFIYAIFISVAVGKNGGAFAWGEFWGNFLSMLLLGAVFTSIGVFISSLTDNQMIAALGSIGANILLCMFDVIADYIPDEGIKGFISSLSVFGRFLRVTQGIISLSGAVFFISIVGGALFLTARSIERRRRA